MAEQASGNAPRQGADTGSLSVLPIAKVSRAGLRALLDLECDEWLDRLGWDFTDVAGLMAEAVVHGVLRGTALVAGAETAGIAVYTSESRRCLIGEIFVAPAYRSPETMGLLVHSMLEAMPGKDRRKRIESQSVVFEAGGADEVFAAAGFERSPRSYLVADSAEVALSGRIRSQGRISLRSWLDSDFGPASEIVYASYKGSVDAVANSGYRTRVGCADLVDALTEGVWCGHFDPAMAHVAVDEATGRMCGVAIASRISPSVAHIGQISVLPSYQGRGVGRALVEGVLTGARLAEIRTVTLAVTLANERALHLYESCGFRRTVDFPVYYRDALGASVRS